MLPKGGIKKGETHAEACQREAFEEAGINGIVFEDYPMTTVISRMTDDGVEKVPVTYYPFLVQKQFKSWPESNDRERHWAQIKEAKKMIDREDFMDILHRFNDLKPWISEAAERHIAGRRKPLKIGWR